MDRHELKVKIADFAYREKICVPQAQVLDRLVDEGYDLEPALAGCIDGFSKIRKMVDYIKSGNKEGIGELIEQQKAEDKFMHDYFPDLVVH